MSDFATFVLDQLPPPPRRVLEVGCGSEGGLVDLLAGAGYDVLGVDPHAPAGERFMRAELLDVEGSFDAVVAGRVLHHVRPLGESLDRLAAVAPLLLVDEFAWGLISAAAQEWYEERYREAVAAGADPPGPGDLDAWRRRHPDLHPHDVLLDALRARYDERAVDWVPYFHRWLGDPALEPLERALVESGSFAAIGWRWSGVRRARR